MKLANCSKKTSKNKSTVKKLSEAEVTKIFKRGIKKVSDCFIERFEPTCFYGKGRSDFIVVRNGKIYFIELKSTIGKQSQAQRRYQKKVESVGSKYFIIRDHQSCIKVIQEILKN